MRFLKIIFASLLTVLGIVFIIQNLEVMTRAVQIRLDLYIRSFTSVQIPLWVLVLFAFFLGVFTASLYGIYELIKQRQTIRHLRQDLEVLGQQVKKASPSEALRPAETEASDSQS